MYVIFDCDFEIMSSNLLILWYFLLEVMATSYLSFSISSCPT